VPAKGRRGPSGGPRVSVGYQLGRAAGDRTGARRQSYGR